MRQKKKQEEKEFILYSGSEFGGRTDDYFPIITSFSAKPSPNISIKIGDEIHLMVEANDPKGRQIFYRWWCSECGLGFNQDWTTSNKMRYTITSEDIKKVAKV